MKKLFVCALALVFLATPAMATDWDFYGNFQYDTYSIDVSKELNGGTYGDTDTKWSDNMISRFGGKVTKGDIYGNAELNSSGLFRHLYGEWNFGAGKLLIGQTWDLSFVGGSKQNGGGGISQMFGASGTRDNQIRLTFGGLQVGLKNPTATAWAADTDISLPALELKYTFATDMFSVIPYLGYQTIDYGYGATDQTTDITSVVWSVLGKVNFGPAYVNARVWGGTNSGDFGFGGIIADNAVFNAATNKFDDRDILCYGAVVGFKVSDTITLEGGYSAISSEITQGTTKTEVSGANEYYLAAVISLAPGVTLQPEYMKVDQGDTKVTGLADAKNGDTTYIGANWVIAF